MSIDSNWKNMQPNEKTTMKLINNNNVVNHQTEVKKYIKLTM